MKHCLIIALLLLAGCQGAQHADDGKPHAQCLNGDLACVDVVVQQDTPHAVYEKQTYYFCGEECRETFTKSPQRYVAKR
jgi:YHS domain-containing protein